MATWGLHIRIAEKLLNHHTHLDDVSFLVGNIGPDCGKPNEDWSAFTPSRDLSHWIDDNKDFRPDLFHDTYLSKPVDDDKAYSFLLGYYVHLLTDTEWSNYIRQKKETHKGYAKLKEDKKFIWTIKKDWYDLDFLYFRDNPDSVFFKTFQYIESFPNYLDYYPTGAIMDRVKYITDFYTTPRENLDREYDYLTKDEMDMFVDKAVHNIMGKLGI